jgi:hypothetical protein
MTENTATVTDAAAAKDASVINGKSAPAGTNRKPAPRKPAANKTAPKPAPAKTAPTGARIWASKDVTPAMAGFTKWIAKNFPELKVDAKPGSRDARLVMIASKAYRYFQASPENTNR